MDPLSPPLSGCPSNPDREGHDRLVVHIPPVQVATTTRFLRFMILGVRGLQQRSASFFLVFSVWQTSIYSESLFRSFYKCNEPPAIQMPGPADQLNEHIASEL